ncbi:MAG: hypothetical protein AAF569_09080, partial [Pseudomonadota bacterium]
TFDKTVQGGHIAFQLNSEDDYRTVCNLSLDIGTRALSIEAQHMTDHSYNLDTLKVAGNA